MNKFDEVFLESKISVCVKDRKGKVIFQNKANQAHCGNSEDVVCNRGCMDVFKDDHPTKEFTEVFNSTQIRNT